MDYSDLIDFLLENYGKMPYSEISKKFGVPVHTVKRLVRKHVDKELICGTGKSTFSRKKIVYSLNHNKFDILSLESCYWAGFLAADGCVINKHLQKKAAKKAPRFSQRDELA